MRVAILGFGLIGGSIALALHGRRPDWPVAAWSPSGEGPSHALGDGVVSTAARTVEAATDRADLVVLAAPPLACLDLLDRLAAMPLPPDAVVTDVASTKRAITARAASLGLRFVGGHPMAGREVTGYAAADADLFEGRPWIVTDGPAVDRERVEALATAVGARIVAMEPDQHDAAVAAVSHLPLVLSAALVEAVAGSRTAGRDDGRRLAAGGWASMTRVARGDSEMGAGILATNHDHVAARLRVLRDVLDGWIEALDADPPDAAALQARLEAARRLADEPPA